MNLVLSMSELVTNAQPSPASYPDLIGSNHGLDTNFICSFACPVCAAFNDVFVDVAPDNPDQDSGEELVVVPLPLIGKFLIY